jgi:hypothetical protein
MSEVFHNKSRISLHAKRIKRGLCERVELSKLLQDCRFEHNHPVFTHLFRNDPLEDDLCFGRIVFVSYSTTLQV